MEFNSITSVRTLDQKCLGLLHNTSITECQDCDRNEDCKVETEALHQQQEFENNLDAVHNAIVGIHRALRNVKKLPVDKQQEIKGEVRNWLKSILSNDL